VDEAASRHVVAIARVDRHGRIFLPTATRTELGIHPGDRILFVARSRGEGLPPEYVLVREADVHA